MLKRNWGILLTVGLGLAISAVLWIQLRPRQPNLPTYQNEQSANQNYRPGGSGCQPEVLAAIRDRGQAARERERCAKEAEDHRLQSNDLVQQTRAADAAQAQADLAHQMAWMGLYGTIGGFLTLLAAGMAAFYARAAAQAAQSSLAHAADDLRPWLQISLEPHSGYNQREVVSLYCNAILKNVGKTPAQQVRVATSAAPLPVEYYQKYGPQEQVVLPDADFEKWQPILPGGQTTRLVSFEVPWDDVELSQGMRTKHMCPYVGVHVTYALPNGKRGETTATFQIGYAVPDEPKNVRGFRKSDRRNLEPLRVNEGIRGKIV